MGDRHTGVPIVLPLRCAPAVLMGFRLKALILSFHKFELVERQSMIPGTGDAHPRVAQKNRLMF
jgi:hypothetical protein